MTTIAIFLVAAVVFGICYAVDKLFVRLFRSKAQHLSGMAVRASKRYGVFGTILSIFGIMGIVNGAGKDKVLLFGGVFALCLGACLAGYYLSYGIFYDGESFLVSGFGKRDQEYAFKDIVSQRLFVVQGGSILVELDMADGRSVMVQTAADGAVTFLDTAFAGWCLAKGLNPQCCSFHDPSKSWWFPHEEEEA